jgi:hypothetical protein
MHNPNELSIESLTVAELRDCLRDSKSTTEFFFTSYKMRDAGEATDALLEAAALVRGSLGSVKHFETELVRRGKNIPKWPAYEELSLVAKWVDDCEAPEEANKEFERMERMEFNEADMYRARSLGIKL